jgi:hypothetical protein
MVLKPWTVTNNAKNADMGKSTTQLNPISQLPLEVVIVATDKDAPTLPLVVAGVKKNLRHPIRAIHIIAPESAQIQSLCHELGCSFVAENSLLPITRKDITYLWQGVDRSGWLFQQLLKLGVDSICQEEHFFVIDSDTILLQPQVFETEDQLLLLHSDEYHLPYFIVNRALTGLTELKTPSCVAHQMLFSVERLRTLHNHIENIHNKPWYECILQFCDYSQGSGFSEFELYGQWCLQKYAHATKCQYWDNLALPRSRLVDLSRLENKYGKKYRSLSFHSYLGDSWRANLSRFLKRKF